MDTEYTERIIEIVHKVQKLGLNTKSKCIGDMMRSEIMILHVIKTNTAQNEGITISALSECLQISKPAVSQMINALEEKGYVERVLTKSDRRIVYVKLTEEGEAAQKRAIQLCLGITRHILEQMGEEDTKTLLQLLERLCSIVSSYKNS